MRDLHWVLTSPHLLAPNAIVPTLPDEQAARIAARSHSWLAALDADPSPLLEFLQSQRNVRRLGFYFASLLEFWVRASPAIGVTDAERQLLVQQQVHEGLGGAVLGELKCVFAPSSADVRHWESHIKFFAFAGTPALARNRWESALPYRRSATSSGRRRAQPWGAAPARAALDHAWGWVQPDHDLPDDDRDLRRRLHLAQRERLEAPAGGSSPKLGAPRLNFCFLHICLFPWIWQG